MMSDRLSVNLKQFKRKVNIKDSLELLGYGIKRKPLKNTRRRFQNCDIAVESGLYQNASQTDEYEVTGSPSDCNESDESSIEETRDATTSYQVHRQLPSSSNLCSGLNKSNPVNSTLAECFWAAPIADCNHPLVSPIEESEKQRFTKDKKTSQRNVETQVMTTSIDEDQHKSTKPSSNGLFSSDSDTELPPRKEDPKWLKTTKDLSFFDSKGDPEWLSSPPMKLCALPPATYTPRNRELNHQQVLNKPTKSGLRTSSPDDTKTIPKAKKSLIENLDLSSILSDVEYGDSVELLPRPPTPGTVNSDEIVPPDYTPPSISDSAGDEHIIAYEDVHVIISASDQEMCQNAVDDYKNVNTYFSPMSYVVDEDVIGHLPSPEHRKPIYVKTIKDWRLSAVRDVLETI